MRQHDRPSGLSRYILAGERPVDAFGHCMRCSPLSVRELSPVMAPPWLPSFRKPNLHQAIRLLSACALACAVSTLFGLPEGYWSLITAVVVMQPDLSHTLRAGRDRVLATLLGAAFGVGLIALRETGLPTLPLFAAGLVPLACVTAVWPAMRLACTTLVIVLLIPAEGDPFARPLFRVLDILIGAVACITVSMLIFPGENEKGGS